MEAIRNGLARWLDPLRDWYQRRNTLGARGERAATRYLRKKRYHIIEAQVRNLYGEIDIIAVDKRKVVFVEVKTRKSHDAGQPAEAVTAEKQRRITRIALAFLKHHDLLEHSARFDVVAVTWPKGQKRPEIVHFESAFEAVGNFQMFT